MDSWPSFGAAVGSETAGGMSRPGSRLGPTPKQPLPPLPLGGGRGHSIVLCEKGDLGKTAKKALKMPLCSASAKSAKRMGKNASEEGGYNWAKSGRTATHDCWRQFFYPLSCSYDGMFEELSAMIFASKRINARVSHAMRTWKLGGLVPMSPEIVESSIRLTASALEGSVVDGFGMTIELDT